MAVNDYATYLTVEASMPNIEMTPEYRAAITTLCTRASRAIDVLFKREPGAFYVTADSTRYFTGDGSDELWIGELAAAPTTVKVAEGGVLTTLTTWAATDYLLWPYNALAEGKPYKRLDIDAINGEKSAWPDYPKCVQIVGKFGFAALTPDEIVQVTIIQTIRWFKRGQQAYQDVGAIAELGQLKYVQALDPDLAAMLSVSKYGRVTI